MPAVLYGPQTESVLLSVNIKELEQILKKGNVRLTHTEPSLFKMVKRLPKPAMIKEFQSHPVSGNFLHIDFYEIDMQRKINVMIPVVTKGHSVGVELGGCCRLFDANRSPLHAGGYPRSNRDRYYRTEYW